MVTSRFDPSIWFAEIISLYNSRGVPQLDRLVSYKADRLGVANLGGDKNLGTGNARLLDSGSDGWFSAISVATVRHRIFKRFRVCAMNEHASGVDMSIAGLQSFRHSTFLLILILPGPKSHGSYETSVNGCSPT